jgi:hypothetical protein
MLQAWKANIAPVQVIDQNELRDANGNFEIQPNDTPLDPALRYYKFLRDLAHVTEELGKAFVAGGGAPERFNEAMGGGLAALLEEIEEGNDIPLDGMFSLSYEDANELNNDVLKVFNNRILEVGAALQGLNDEDGDFDEENIEASIAVLSEYHEVATKYFKAIFNKYFEQGGSPDGLTDHAKQVNENIPLFVKEIMAEILGDRVERFPEGLFNMLATLEYDDEEDEENEEEENEEDEENEEEENEEEENEEEAPQYDEEGYDKDGFNEAGWNRTGFNREGFNEEGFDQNGYDINGYDINGYDIDGFDINGLMPAMMKRARKKKEK